MHHFKKLLLVVGLGFLLFAPKAQAAITFDASSSVNYTAATVVTSTLTIGAGCVNPLLVLMSENTVTSTGVTISGGTATSAIVFSSNGHSVDMWYLIAPATGLHNATVTYAGGRTGGMAMESYCGVDQTSPFDTKGTGTVSLKTVVTSTITTTVANDVLVDAVSRIAETTKAVNNSGQQVLFVDVGNTNKLDSSFYLSTSTQSYLLGWTYTAASVSMAYGISAFKPFVASGGATNATSQTMASFNGLLIARGSTLQVKGSTLRVMP